METTERLSPVIPADWVAGPPQGQWTYEDYAAIPEDGHRYEVVDGVLYVLPSLDVRHQGTVGKIFAYLHGFVQSAGLGEVFVGPLDVELTYRNVVQPDVLVVLNEHLDRISESRIVGVPDLVVEVASSVTARHDLHEKLGIYERVGVPEYWVVYPEAQTIEILILEHGVYSSLGLFDGQVTLPSQMLPDLPVRVEQFFSGI